MTKLQNVWTYLIHALVTILIILILAMWVILLLNLFGINVERRLSRYCNSWPCRGGGLTWQYDQINQSNGGEKKNPKAELDRRAVSDVGTVSGREQGGFKGEIRFRDHGTSEEADLGAHCTTDQCVLPSPFTHKQWVREALVRAAIQSQSGGCSTQASIFSIRWELGAARAAVAADLAYLAMMRSHFMCPFTGLFIEGGLHAKQLSQVPETVSGVLEKSNTRLKEEIDGSLIQLVELPQRWEEFTFKRWDRPIILKLKEGAIAWSKSYISNFFCSHVLPCEMHKRNKTRNMIICALFCSSGPKYEPEPSTSSAHTQPVTAPVPSSATSPTPSLLEKKLEAEIDVLMQQKKVLSLREEYYRLKIEHLKNKLADN